MRKDVGDSSSVAHAWATNTTSEVWSDMTPKCSTLKLAETSENNQLLYHQSCWLVWSIRLHTAHSLCIPHLACSFWKMEMKRHAAPRKAASCPAQGSVSTTSWQCPYTATHLGLFLFPPQTHQTPTPWRWGHLVSKSAPNTLQYKHPATPGWGWGLISDKEVETRQITSR